MIKERFSIQFDNLETEMSTLIFIPKTTYLEQLKFFKSQCEKTQQNEVPAEMFPEKIYKKQHHAETMSIFTIGTATVYLTKYSCLDGYQFTKKKGGKI